MATATPTNPDELLEELSDQDKVKKMVADGTFAPFVKGYVQAVQEKDRDLKAQIKEQVQMGLAEFAERNGQDPKRLDMRAVNTAQPAPNTNNPKAPGAALNGLFPDLYSFLQATWHGGNPSSEVRNKLQQIRDYQEKVPSEGGFLVPEEFRSQLLMLQLPNAVVRPRATVIPMSSARLSIPTVDETSRVSSVHGGIIVYRTEEGAELTESAASFAAVKLDASKQTALAHVTNELVRDWGAFGAFMDATLPGAMAFSEDQDFLGGNGVGEPLGALHSGNGALVVVAKETGQTAATIVWQNVIKMYARMLPTSVGRAVWVASPDTFVELATMALEVGTGGSAIWLTNGVEAPTLTLLGRPVIMTENAPAGLGTQGDLSFVDFGMYLVGDRQMVTVDSSPHVKFTSDKTTFRAIARNDGRPWLLSALTPHNNSATLSPYVQLDDRA